MKKGTESRVRYRNTYEGIDQCFTGKAKDFRTGNGNQNPVISGDTSNISDALEVTEEELKYLRDIAEQEAVNRYTVAEVSVDMSGMQNTVNNGTDLDGFVSGLTDAVNEAVDSITEGVHE